MTERATLEVRASLIGVGQVPMIDFGDDWPHPVYTLGDDGESVCVQTLGGRYRTKLVLDFFRLQGPSRQGVLDQLSDRLRTLCLAAGFAGTATVLIRLTSVELGSDGRPVWILEPAACFSRWTDWFPPGEPICLVDDVDMGEHDERIRHETLAHDVLES